MAGEDNYKQLPNSGTHNCFGCSPVNSAGLQMKFFADDKSVFSRLTVPAHLCGWNKIVHGGIIATILDETMGWAGIYMLKKITLTQTLRVDFIKAVRVDQDLKVEGKVRDQRGERQADIEAFLYNAQGELCARSQGDFVLLSPKVARRLGMMTADDIKYFFEPLRDLKAGAG
ncbi:MAG: PaaI family thioesterase [Desulfobacterales bacterium]|nr:MAG: PaaI family thioesterase [Desulfobacterales bacterium]